MAICVCARRRAGNKARRLSTPQAQEEAGGPAGQPARGNPATIKTPAKKREGRGVPPVMPVFLNGDPVTLTQRERK